MCKNTKRTILSLGVERIAQTVGFIISRFLVVVHFRQLREILLYHHYYIVFQKYCQEYARQTWRVFRDFFVKKR